MRDSLAAAFWPGPLTLVVWARDDAPPAVVASTGAGRTIGVRVPAHPLALELLARCGPLVASSANRSGEPTPPTVDGVRAVFGGAVDAYLDGGPGARIGVDGRGRHDRARESAARGPVTADMLRSVLGVRFEGV